MIANTPKPPYYAVIFSTVRTNVDNGYTKMAERMEYLAKQQEGFLGIETARNEVGITVSYWRDRDAIRNWRIHAEHLVAQQMGRQEFYSWYHLRVAEVVTHRMFDADAAAR